MSFYFKSPEPLIKHLRYLYNDELSPVRLNKLLYFLYGMYVMQYDKATSTLDVLTGVDESKQLPTELFNGQFYADDFGPLLRETTVTTDQKAFDFSEDGVIGLLIEAFIQETSKPILDLSDLELVQRSKQDKAWLNAFLSDDKLMDNKQIKKRLSLRKELSSYGAQSRTNTTFKRTQRT